MAPKKQKRLLPASDDSDKMPPPPAPSLRRLAPAPPSSAGPLITPMTPEQKASFSQFTASLLPTPSSSMKYKQPLVGNEIEIFPSSDSLDSLTHFAPSSPRPKDAPPIKFEPFPSLLSSLGDVATTGASRRMSKSPKKEWSPDEEVSAGVEEEFNPWTIKRSKDEYHNIRNPPLPVGKTVFVGDVTLVVTSYMPDEQFSHLHAMEVINHVCGLLAAKHKAKENLVLSDWKDVQDRFAPVLNSNRTQLFVYFQGFLRPKEVPSGESETSSKNVLFWGRGCVGLPEHFHETGLSVEASISSYRTTAKARFVITRKSPLHQTWYLLAQDIFTRDVQPIQSHWPGYPPKTHLNEQEGAQGGYSDAPSRSTSASSILQEQNESSDEATQDVEVAEEVSEDIDETGESSHQAPRMMTANLFQSAAGSASPPTLLRRSTRRLGVVIDNVPALGEERYHHGSLEEVNEGDEREYELEEGEIMEF